MQEADGLPEEWALIRAWLPEDLNIVARESGFFVRARGLQDADLWLRLILMHVAGGLSLRQTALRARELGLARVSSVALHKRMKRAELWIARLTEHVLQTRRMAVPKLPELRPVRVIDATNVQEPGSTGTFLRVHYSLRLPEMRCDHYEITGAEGGERLARFKFKKSEIVLADRGYSHRAGGACVRQAGADFILRWNPALFPLVNPQGKPLLPLKELRELKIHQVAEWEGSFSWESKTYPVRLCAIRKSRLAAEKARRKSLRKAQKNGTKPDQHMLELTNYVLLLTSLSRDSLSTSRVLEFYRCRWQVELAFKRLKSLLEMGCLPKSNDDTARTWIQAKVLVALIIERILTEGRFFSPWAYRGFGEPMALLH